MKHIIFLLILLVVLPGIPAISEGQIITQEQLDQQDIDTVSLECSWLFDGAVSFAHAGKWYARLPFRCYSLKPLDDGTYLVVWRKSDVTHTLMPLIDCLLDGGILGPCYHEHFEPYAVEKARGQVERLRKHLKTYQTPPEPPSIDWEGLGLPPP